MLVLLYIIIGKYCFHYYEYDYVIKPDSIAYFLYSPGTKCSLYIATVLIHAICKILYCCQASTNILFVTCLVVENTPYTCIHWRVYSTSVFDYFNIYVCFAVQ